MPDTARRTKTGAKAALFSDRSALANEAYRAGYESVTEALSVEVVQHDPQVDLFAAAAALKAYYEAGAAMREADRNKRRAKKIVAALKAGIYGGWVLRWTPSTREVVDLAAVTETYRRLNLGPVPMRYCADSMEVDKVDADGVVQP